MKKTIYSILCVCIFTMQLAGCSAVGKNTDGTLPESEARSEINESDGENVTSQIETTENEPTETSAIETESKGQSEDYAEIFRKTFSYIEDYGRLSGSELTEEWYLKYVRDNYGVSDDWTPADVVYPFSEYTSCRYNYYMERDINGDGENENIIYGADGSGADRWSYLAFYDAGKGSWMHFMSDASLEAAVANEIHMGDEQKKWLIKQLKEKEIPDAGISGFEYGMTYMYPSNPAVMEDGSIMVAFYGNNGHNVEENDYISLEALVQYKWSDETGNFEITNYALSIESEGALCYSDEAFMKEIY